MKTNTVTKILLFSALVFIAAHQAFASETNGTITSGGNNGYAWSNQAGWVNFGCSNCGINITDSGITGYAWNNNYGWINMKPANGGVTVAANGALSSYAWGSSLGWINFSGVAMNSSGKFTGTATGTSIGTLTFDCTNCDVHTDYRPQNFRTTVPAQAAAVSGGGGGGGISFVFGPVGQEVPARIEAVGVPMKLFPAQSGTLTQYLTDRKIVMLDAPSNMYSDDITFTIREETVSFDTVAPGISVIGNSLFDVAAWDKANNPVRSFLKSVKITLTIPELLRGRADLGVYFFDGAASLPAGRQGAWVNIPDAVFSGDEVSFYVDHLTLFGIFGGSSLPPIIEFIIPAPEQAGIETPPGIQAPAEITTGELSPGIQAPGEKAEIATEEIPPAEIVSEEPPPLFDIQLGLGPLESIGGRVFIVIIMGAAAAAAVIYISRRRKTRKWTEM